MRFCVFYILLIMMIFSPCWSRAAETEPSPVQELTAQEVQQAFETAEKAQLDLEGLQALIDRNRVAIIDLRAPERYAADHIAGAVNIPLTALTEKTVAAAVPDKETPIVLMCDNSLMPTRMIAMTLQGWPVVKAAGYENVYRLNLWQDRDGRILTEGEIRQKLPFENHLTKEIKP